MAHSHLCDDGKCLVPTFDGAFLSSDSRDAMGQVLHGSATTTEAVHRAIQHSQESLRALAKRFGINQKTAAKWNILWRRKSCRKARTNISEVAAYLCASRKPTMEYHSEHTGAPARATDESRIGTEWLPHRGVKDSNRAREGGFRAFRSPSKF
jgi:hypothetical protein